MTATAPIGPRHPERRLAVAYAPIAAREGLAILFALDERLGDGIGRAREPTIGLIRLAWWRDALAALDAALPPGEPLLQAAATLRSHGITGAALSAMVDGWEVVLDDPDLTPDSIALHAEARGAALFQLAGLVLGRSDDRLAAAGGGWALADLARRVPDAAAATKLLTSAAPMLDRALEAKWPRILRPLGMLAVMARDDSRRGVAALRPPASRGRLMRLIAHRWTGR